MVKGAGIVGTWHCHLLPRRLVQAVLYEGIAIAVVTPVLALVFSYPPESAFVLSVVMSTIALAWIYVFNSVFERWEARQAVKGRSLVRRMLHGVDFEAGLTLILVSVMAYWLNVTLVEALVADLGLLVFFFYYTVGFTGAVDKVFGLPQSAQ